ncbi:MAG: ATP/GTP-binding protein [Desulfurococcus sp.]|nr:ATP/GTP-binding protein [Desulfurococcus sp.]
MPYFIVVLGTAGSGKTSLTSMLQTYLESHELDAATVNLDPAVETLPYTPDVDIRDYVDAREVMRKTGLGPNGALLASIDMLLANIHELEELVWSLKANYIVIDTPGQMELFAFRDAGPIVLESIIKDAKAVSLYLMDSTYLLKGSNAFSALLLAASTHARLGYPQVNVLTKIDVLNSGELERILESLSDPEALSSDIAREKQASLIWDESEISVLLEKLLVFDVVPVSNVSGEGFDSLYAAIQRVLAGGEDYLTEEPNPVL